MYEEKLLIDIFTIKFYTMFPYHNRIKQRINNNELVHYEYVEKYKQITPCLLLHFKTEPYIRPIRAHRFEMYEVILADWENKK